MATEAVVPRGPEQAVRGPPSARAASGATANDDSKPRGVRARAAIRRAERAGGGREGAVVNRWLVLVIACLAQFIVVLDNTIGNGALPSIQHGLHFSAANLQWVVNGYTLVFGGFLMLGGRAAHLLGPRGPFIAG